MDINTRQGFIKKQISDNEALCQLPIAMAYVPMQKWKDIYKTEIALSRGTIFAELDMPFKGKGVI